VLLENWGTGAFLLEDGHNFVDVREAGIGDGRLAV
jgi:hypothetical protein